MPETIDDVRTIDDLRAYIHQELCQKENLLADQFTMTEMELTRRSRQCGLQFLLQGPRTVRLGAIWASDHNSIYFYDTQGMRYGKVRLRNRLQMQEHDDEQNDDEQIMSARSCHNAPTSTESSAA